MATTNIKHAYEVSIDAVKTGERIKEFRVKNKKTIQDIAEFFNGISVQAIYKWERGVTFPNIDNLFALAKLYHVSTDELLVERAA
jgi:transcriptional regulator with XRE-family HTH domain